MTAQFRRWWGDKEGLVRRPSGGLGRLWRLTEIGKLLELDFRQSKRHEACSQPAMWSELDCFKPSGTLSMGKEERPEEKPFSKVRGADA